MEDDTQQLPHGPLNCSPQQHASQAEAAGAITRFGVHQHTPVRTMPAKRMRPLRGSTPLSDLRSTTSFTVMNPGSEPSGCCSMVRSCVPIFHCAKPGME